MRVALLCIRHVVKRFNRDRATFVANLPEAVNYTVASAGDAPASLTYGPPFFSLAAGLSRSPDVTVGLNRQLNNQKNTLDGIVQAKGAIRNLYAIEIGNEPDCTCDLLHDSASLHILIAIDSIPPNFANCTFFEAVESHH